MGERVVVTGYGTVSAAALDSKGFETALREGRRCFREIVPHYPYLKGLNSTHAGLIIQFEPDPRDPPEIQKLDRNVHLALRALREALATAGLVNTTLGKRAALVFGTCSGGMRSVEKHHLQLSLGIDNVDEDLVFSKRYYTTAKVLSHIAGASGPTMTVVTACAAGAGAIAQGIDLIRAGLADLVLAGGSDSFAPSTLVGFDALKATCVGMCSPFSTNIGLNLGEGSAFLVLERLEHAHDRRAKIHAEILGYGLSNDAYHPTAPDPSTKGQVAAMARALRDSGKKAEEIDYINAHGTGTRANDPAESKAISKLLGKRADQVPVSSTKSIIGHCLGGAGALEASATIIAAKGDFLPSTAGFDSPRDGCRLADYVPSPGRPWRGRIALTNSFGFAGNNACLVFDMKPAIDSQTVSQERPRVTPTRPVAVVTGVGVVTSGGIGLSPLSGGRSHLRELSRFSPPADPFPVGEVEPIDARSIDRRLDLKGMDYCSQFATIAVRSALLDAKIPLRPSVMAEVGMVLGLSTGPSRGESLHVSTVLENNFRLDTLGAFPFVVQNEVAGHVARSLLLRGHNTVLSVGHGAGLAALISSSLAVEQKHAEVVVAAAADELGQRPLQDAHKIGQIGPTSGVVPGEGAGALVVEAREHALARDTKIIAEILGYDMSTDTDSHMHFSGNCLSRSLEQSLARARLRLRDIDEVIITDSGTPAAKQEKKILRKLFAPHQPTFYSLAPQIGFAEASLPLINLAHIFCNGAENRLVLAVSLSPEGICNVAVFRTLS